MEPFQGLEALVDLAEGDLDGSQAVVHAAQVVADIGVVGGEVGLYGVDSVDEFGAQHRGMLAIVANGINSRLNTMNARIEALRSDMRDDHHGLDTRLRNVEIEFGKVGPGTSAV